MDYIYHHGIKGQKWGVRRTPEQLGRKTIGTISPYGYHDDYLKAHNNKPIEAMSNDELRARITRIQLEQQYSSISEQEKKRGTKIFNSTVKTINDAATLSSSIIKLKHNWDLIFKKNDGDKQKQKDKDNKKESGK